MLCFRPGSEEDAQRAVACVNACVGIADPAEAIAAVRSYIAAFDLPVEEFPEDMVAVLEARGVVIEAAYARICVALGLPAPSYTKEDL